MAFDLSEMLKGAVSDLDTSREQIEYIPLEQIDKDPNNFYQLSNIDGLADNIATCGLQQPIRVRPHPDERKRYIIVSGHRRREAVEMLSQEDPEHWKTIPCIVERENVSPALQQLRLIYANSSTRTLTSAELGEQAAQVEKLLYELKEQGYEFPGRMRDHVAQAVQASKTKLARLKVIQDHLNGCWLPAYRADIIKEDTAYKLARLSTEDQRCIHQARKDRGYADRWLTAGTVEAIGKAFEQIDGLACEQADGVPCRSADRKKRKIAENEYSTSSQCTSCCAQCPVLASCKFACPYLSAQIEQMRAERKASSQKAAQERADRQRPVIERIQALWTRFGVARKAAGVTIDDANRAAGWHSGALSDQRVVEARENGKVAITATTESPFGYSNSHIAALEKLADCFGCTTDYLLCRTDSPGVSANVSKSDTWHTGEPVAAGGYAVLARYCDGGRAVLVEMDWDGESWWEGGMDATDLGVQILKWVRLPKEVE